MTLPCQCLSCSECYFPFTWWGHKTGVPSVLSFWWGRGSFSNLFLSAEGWAVQGLPQAATAHLWEPVQLWLPHSLPQPRAGVGVAVGPISLYLLREDAFWLGVPPACWIFFSFKKSGVNYSDLMHFHLYKILWDSIWPFIWALDLDLSLHVVNRDYII